MKSKILKIKELVDDLLSELESLEKPEITLENKKISKDFEILKDLLFSEKWPEAVFAAQIADENSEKDKEERAEGICDILLPPLENKKFLDFGCGEGHAAKYMGKNCSLSIGYDMIKNSKSNLKWEEKEDNCLLTTDFQKVRENGPYDAILLYDVLDHAKEEEEVLSKAKSVLTDSGKIYLRCHPWTGRHGGHMYRKINKAFVHLVFLDDELNELGIQPEYINKFTAPIANYYRIIKNSQLNIEQEEIDSQEVESFFSQHPLVRKRILDSFGIKEWSESKPVFQMSQCFVDFVLRK